MKVYTERSRSGFTLVEVLIAMGIAIVVGALLLVIIVNSAGLFYQQSSKVEQGLGVNEALAKISSTAREASGIAASYTQDSTTYTTGVTTLVLKLPSEDASGNIIANTFDHFIFFLDATKLRLKSFPNPASFRKAADQIFSTHVDSLSFGYFDNAIPPSEVLPTSAKRVVISLTLKQKSGANFETKTATTEANLRND